MESYKNYSFRKSELETDCDIFFAVDRFSTKLTRVVYSANFELDRYEGKG
jgi:hypothetical protein